MLNRVQRLLMNNSLKYVRLLESSGVTREQAETHIQIITEFLEGDLVTKQDLKILENRVDLRFEKVEARFESLDKKIESTIERFEHKLLESEYRMTIKLGSIVTVVVAASTAIGKLF